ADERAGHSSPAERVASTGAAPCPHRGAAFASRSGGAPCLQQAATCPLAAAQRRCGAAATTVAPMRLRLSSTESRRYVRLEGFIVGRHAGAGPAVCRTNIAKATFPFPLARLKVR